MDKFMELWVKALKMRPHLCLDFGYSSICDYSLSIFDKTKRPAGDWGSAIISVQHCDKDLVFCESYVKLAEYLSDKCGGY